MLYLFGDGRYMETDFDIDKKSKHDCVYSGSSNNINEKSR
jgi:hypothetical protein